MWAAVCLSGTVGLAGAARPAAGADVADGSLAAASRPAAAAAIEPARRGDGDGVSGAELRARFWAAEVRRIDGEIARQRQLIQRWSAHPDGDPAKPAAVSGELARKERELAQARESIAAAEQAPKGGAFRKPAPDDWARVDTTMASKIKLRDDLQLIIGSLTAQLGPTHPSVVYRQKELEPLNAAIAKLSEDLDAKYLIRWAHDGSGGTLVPRDVAVLREAEKRLAAELQELTPRLVQLREVSTQVQAARDEIKALGTRAARAAERLRMAEFIRDESKADRSKVAATQPDAGRHP